jgi:hypothetical protein
MLINKGIQRKEEFVILGGCEVENGFSLHT